jgi:hypothetical protein
MHLPIGNLFPPTTRLYRTEKSVINSCFPAAADLIPLSTHLSGKTSPLSAIHPSLPEFQKGAVKNGIFFAQTAVTTHPYCKTLPRRSSPAHFLRRAVIGSILNTYRLCSTIFYSVLCSGLSLIPRTLPLLFPQYSELSTQYCLNCSATLLRTRRKCVVRQSGSSFPFCRRWCDDRVALLPLPAVQDRRFSATFACCRLSNWREYRH